MAELDMEIRDMLAEDVHPTKISKALKIPLSMVYDVLESISDLDEELSPFITVNS